MLAYGKHLAQQCMSCHRLDGVGGAIPSIVGRPKDQFIAALRSYKTNASANPVMVSVAQALSDEEMTALAAYFGSLAPASKDKSKSRKGG